MGTYEAVMQQVIEMGPDEWQVRADAGKVVTSTCLFHGKHQVQVRWVEVEVWVLQVVRGRIGHERVVAYMLEFGVACTPACGPVFGWGRGCEH